MYQTLKELDTINRLLGGNAVTLGALRRLVRKRPGRTSFKVADLGCGGGDLMLAIVKWGLKHKLDMQCTGIDANPDVVKYAQEHTQHEPLVTAQTMNIFSPVFKEQAFDVIHCSLFTHHFTDKELVGMFKQWTQQAQVGVVINDLHRHPLAYYSIKLLTRLFSKSPMVRYDGPLSVRRAFVRKELEALLNQAGIKEYTLRWCWAFRWQLIIPKQEG